MNNSTTHTKDHIMTRALSLLLAGLMSLGLFGTLPARFHCTAAAEGTQCLLQRRVRMHCRMPRPEAMMRGSQRLK